MAAFSEALQENVLALLCYDRKYSSSISLLVKTDMFDNEIYREIADKAIKYEREYKQPISDHLIDVFEDKIKDDKNKKRAKLFITVISSLRELKDEINGEFVMKELNSFIREAQTRLMLKEAFEKFQEGNLDAVDNIINNRHKRMIEIFDPGIMFGKDIKRTLKFLNQDEELFRTNITHLDKMGICPARKELYTFVALPNFGKSWAISHFGKVAVITRNTVVHITLEMDENKVSQRYIQSFLGVAKNKEETKQVAFDVNDKGYVSNIRLERIINKLSLKDEDIEGKILKKLATLYKPRLIIKQFPTGMLTVEMLIGYLDNLRTFYNIFPDMLLVDYADLLKLDSRHVREDTGRVYKELRGVAVDQNIAVVTASQANRAGEDSVLLTRKNLAEDFSKVAISDNVITYNQTTYERNFGLARLFVDKARNDRRGDTILISQNYNRGQFCINSGYMNTNYFKSLESNNNLYDDEDDEDRPKIKRTKLRITKKERD